MPGRITNKWVFTFRQDGTSMSGQITIGGSSLKVALERFEDEFPKQAPHIIMAEEVN